MYMYSGGKDIYIILYLWFDYNATKSNQMTKIKTTNIIDLGPAFFDPPLLFSDPPRFFLTSPPLYFDPLQI